MQLETFVASLAARLPALAAVGAVLPTEAYALVAARKLLFFHGRSGWCDSLSHQPPAADPAANSYERSRGDARIIGHAVGLAPS